MCVYFQMKNLVFLFLLIILISTIRVELFKFPAYPVDEVLLRPRVLNRFNIEDVRLGSDPLPLDGVLLMLSRFLQVKMTTLNQLCFGLKTKKLEL